MKARETCLVMETLSGAYDEASGAFYRNNEALVASREGQAQLDETLAGLGETISNVKNSLPGRVPPGNFGSHLSLYRHGQRRGRGG